MLTPLNLPYISERFLGVTIPDKGMMYACSYDGLHQLTLEDPVRIETNELGREDFDLLQSKGETLGIFDGTPILEDSRTKIIYCFDSTRDAQSVEVQQGEKTEVLAFATLSGDWFFATLSKCGKFLMLAEPYNIEVYVIA